MTCILLSDTHGQHWSIDTQPADVLIHAGDISRHGYKEEVESFIEWFIEQPQTYKIFIAGNHDFYLEKTSSDVIQSMLPENTWYLNDSGIRIKNYNFWGSPVQPRFFNWAFNRDRGKDIDRHWKLIPKHTDVVITHGPPYGILDLTERNLNVGCEDLRKRIRTIQPKLHLFGHIHESRGQIAKNNTDFINATVLNEYYQNVYKPIQYQLLTK